MSYNGVHVKHKLNTDVFTKSIAVQLVRDMQILLFVFDQMKQSLDTIV